MRGALSYEKLWALQRGLAHHRGGRAGRYRRPERRRQEHAAQGDLRRAQADRRARPTIRGRRGPDPRAGHRLRPRAHRAARTSTSTPSCSAAAAREIDEQLDEIVDFSGLGDFIRAPIRNYSSGMIARLGFSIATAWLPDILILDEVLSVGDASFTGSCEERLDEIPRRPAPPCCWSPTTRKPSARAARAASGSTPAACATTAIRSGCWALRGGGGRRGTAAGHRRARPARARRRRAAAQAEDDAAAPPEIAAGPAHGPT